MGPRRGRRHADRAAVRLRHEPRGNRVNPREAAGKGPTYHHAWRGEEPRKDPRGDREDADYLERRELNTRFHSVLLARRGRATVARFAPSAAENWPKAQFVSANWYDTFRMERDT